MNPEKPKGKRGPEGEREMELPPLPWIEAADNPWGVRLLDVRPITQFMLSWSSDPISALNLTSFRGDDGTSFLGEEPLVPRVVRADLRFPIDRMLADGVLYTPTEMEHKWALFCHRRQILIVRSWQRKVFAIAEVEERGDHVVITAIRGSFSGDDEAPDFTARVVDFLLRSHALDVEYPAPLPAGDVSDTGDAGLWCRMMFGDRVAYATPHELERRDPEQPLRTISLLHIRAARGDAAGIEESLRAGIPVDLLGKDGSAPLHWAMACKDPAIAALLLDRGSPVDVRSEKGATPLMSAVEVGSLEKAALLLDRGADVNARDGRGYTSLHRAAEVGHADFVRLLLERGASPDPEAQGDTPRSLAEAHGKSEIVAILDGHRGGGSS